MKDVVESKLFVSDSPGHPTLRHMKFSEGKINGTHALSHEALMLNL